MTCINLRLLPTSVYPYVNKRHTCYPLSFSRISHRIDLTYCTFDPASLSRLAMPLGLPTFATDFEFLSLANYSLFRKRSRTTMVRTRCGGYRLCDWSSNLRRVAKDSNVILPFLSSSSFSSYFSSSSSILSCFDRRCVIVVELSLYRAHGGGGERAVNDLSQWFDNRFKMFVLLDSIGLQSAMSCESIRSSFQSPSWFFSRSHTSTIFLSCEVSIRTDHVMISPIR